MQLTLAFSSCPNDTFVFDAMVHKKIDTEGLDFEVSITDIEDLNNLAFKQEFDITKISFSAFSKLTKHYALLDSGAALGDNCGPILVSKPNKILSPNSKIAIPGKHTTANMLLNIFFPNYQNKVEFNFSDIERQILSDRVDAGVIIHENRFTYKELGLEAVQDLGDSWQLIEHLPIPLGGIVVSRKYEYITQQKIERVIRRSIEYAFNNPDSSNEYVMSNAQGIKRHVLDSHIDLYVNNYSLSLGEKGREAVLRLLRASGFSCNNSSIFIRNFT